MSDYRLIFDAVRDYANRSPDHPAMIFDNRVTTYAELMLEANRVANGLMALALQPQSRVAILTGNNDYFFEIWLGSTLGNFVLTPVNARLAPPEVVYIVNDSRAEVLFVDEAFHSLVEGVVDDLTTVREIISLGSHSDWPDYLQWRDRQSADELRASVDAEDTMVQMYTSGTTGFPKGVELNHPSVLACVSSMMGQKAWPPNEVALVTAPLFHTAGAAWANCALQSGGTVILLPETTPATILNAFEVHKVTQALLVPAVIQMVLQAPECIGTDFSHLKRMLYGASPIPVSVLRQAVAIFGCEFEQGYGLTESVGPIAMLRPDDHLNNRKMQSSGKPVPGAKIRVVDKDGRDCATGDVGEIIVESVQVMNGYWNRPADTADAVRDGWLHTGDAGYFDDDGYLFIHDRLKDMIVSGAENVYPAEVERVLAGFPGIADVAVFGVPDEKWGEAVKAVVIANPGVTLDEKEIIDFAHQHMAPFKCPKTVDLNLSIPRNASGKILKKELRAPYWEGHEKKI